MIDELSTEVTDFYYDYDPYEFKDNYNDYNEGLEATQQVLSSKSETKKLIFDLKEINDDLYGDEDKIIKELVRIPRFNDFSHEEEGGLIGDAGSLLHVMGYHNYSILVFQLHCKVFYFRS